MMLDEGKARTLIPTKTLIPRRLAHLLHRPRLVDRLHRYIDLAITIITAPAGYGKTSLLIDYAHDAPFPVCWLSLDASDRDLYTFAEYLVGALRRQFPQFGQATHQALASNLDLRANPSALTGIIIQDMLENIPEFFALILDDYHSVDDSREINALLDSFLTYRPEHCHTILASRTAPVGLPIIQLTARSRVAGIGPTHLAFTGDEIQALLKQAHNIHLSSEQAKELAAESEGWITAILLSTEAMWRGMRDSLARARAQEGPIYTYLADQVFSQQPSHLRDFLLASATLQEMNETLCREALGLSNVTETLQEVERRGVFVMPLVDETTGTWYRYHHLFRGFLQARLQSKTPAHFRELHHRAADWFESQAQWESAVAHRLSALSTHQAFQDAPSPSEEALADARTVAKTMDAGLTSLFYAGRMDRLVAWYEAVPGSIRLELPRLSLFAARALSNTGRPDEALPLLLQAEESFIERGETERALLTALTRANIWFVWGRYAELLALTEEILEKAVDYPTPAADAHRMAGLACLYLGRPEQAVDNVRASLNLYRKLGQAKETAMAYTDLSLVLLRMGRLSEGWACQEKAIAFYRKTGPSGEFATLLNNVAQERYYLTGNYAPALTYLSEALEVAQAAGVPRAQAFALLTTADLYRDLGALEQAAALYTQAQGIAQRLGHATLINFAVEGIAQTRLLSGDLVEGLGLATQARNHAQERDDVYLLGWSCLTLGAAYLETGNPTKALAEIERGRDFLAQGGARRDLTRAYMLLARARQATGDPDGALAALDQALDIGIETQTIHYLVKEGQRAFDLLRKMQKQTPADRRLSEILQRIRALPNVAREIVGGVAPYALPHKPSLRFFGFGPGRVDRDGEPLPGAAWRSALARYVLFYLLVQSPRSRDQIAVVFWPNASRDKAKAIFHTVKHQAHHALGRSLIVYEDGVYYIELEPDCWFDAAVFESLVDGQDNRQARLEEAVSLYRGDFLEDYDGEWCVPIRERLRLRFRDALLELAEGYIDQRQFDRAFALLSRAIAIDDLHEPGHRALLRLYARDGRSHAAMDHFQRLEQRLKEKGIPLTPETLALYQEIRVSAGASES